MQKLKNRFQVIFKFGRPLELPKLFGLPRNITIEQNGEKIISLTVCNENISDQEEEIKKAIDLVSPILNFILINTGQPTGYNIETLFNDFSEKNVTRFSTSIGIVGSAYSKKSLDVSVILQLNKREKGMLREYSLFWKDKEVENEIKHLYKILESEYGKCGTDCTLKAVRDFVSHPEITNHKTKGIILPIFGVNIFDCYDTEQIKKLQPYLIQLKNKSETLLKQKKILL